MTTLRGLFGLAAVVVFLLAAALPWILPATAVASWLGAVATAIGWVMLVFFALVYAPGQALKEYKDSLGRDFYRWDAEANINRAYRVFHRLYRAGEQWRSGVVEHRQAWDENVRKAMLEHCNRTCLNIYLVNTGRIHAVFPLPDDRYEVAMQHINSMLEREFDVDLRWPK